MCGNESEDALIGLMCAEAEAMGFVRDGVVQLTDQERSDMCTFWLDHLKPVDMLR